MTALMALYHFLLLVALYLLKPARDSLFLTELGADQLPFVFILIALVGLPVTAMYSGAGRRFDLKRLVRIATLCVVASFVLLRWLLSMQAPWVFYVFYVGVSIFGILSVSQFWLLANAVFDASQAKRLFVVLGLGGIAGAIAGGGITSLLVRTVGISTRDLILVSVALLLATIPLVDAIWRRRPPGLGEQARTETEGESGKRPLADVIRTVMRSRYQLLIVGIIAATTLCSTIVDFQFKTISAEAFTDENQLTTFLGAFYGGVSVLSVIFQLLVTYRLLRWVGVGGIIFLLPVMLLGGSVWFLAVPGLAAATCVRGMEGSLSYSTDKTGRELLYLPVPLAVKKRTKVFIDLFVDRTVQGIAGLLLLLFTMVLGLSPRHISLIVMIVAGLWLVLALATRRGYIDAFRAALARREIHAADLTGGITDPSVVRALTVSLRSPNAREVTYALDMLKTVHSPEIESSVVALLDHRDPGVRTGALQTIFGFAGRAHLPDVTRVLADDDLIVRREAIHLAAWHDAEGRLPTLERFLREDDQRLVLATIDCIAEYGGRKEHALLEEHADAIFAMPSSDFDVEMDRAVARIIGKLKRPEYYRFLEQLIDHEHPAVVIEAIRAMGEACDSRHVSILLGLLSDTRYRAAASTALTRYGPEILETLRDTMTDPAVHLKVRAAVARIISRMPHQESVDILIELLGSIDSRLRFQVIRALNRLRSGFAHLRFNRAGVTAAWVEESRRCYAVLQALQVNDGAIDDDACRLLQRALVERKYETLERMFRLLGLRYPAADIYNAYLALLDGNRAVRASAVELLDNTLSAQEKRYLFPIIEAQPGAFPVDGNDGSVETSRPDRSAALARLLEGDDLWLKACAVYCVPSENDRVLWGLVQRTAADPDPTVSETCRLVLDRRKATGNV